ncbi:OmpA family protein [Arcticibacterium luteifluviistationis]|nr:OmpA family protein [Arcticibacterium luteifluviistationis]
MNIRTSMLKKCAGLLTLFTLIVFQSFSQASLKAGNRNFERLSYVEAIKNYEGFVESAKPDDEDLPEGLSKLAFCYKKLQDHTNAERVYRILFKNHESILDSKEYLNFAQVLASNSKYRESQKYYSLYGERQSSDLRAKNFTVAYMDRSTFARDSSLYQVKYLDAINSSQADFSPVYFGKGLVFVSAREEDKFIKRVFMNNQTPFLDLFEYPDTTKLSINYKGKTVASLSKSGKGGSIAALSEGLEGFSKKLNSKYHEGPVTFFSDQKQVIFTRNNYIGNKTEKSEDGINKLKLYSAKFDGSKWDHIDELPFDSDEYSCGHPSLNMGNTKLYFVSDMPGGYGGTDIYVVEYNGGNWGNPKNMGRDINSEGNEMFPFIDEFDNIYFASDGHAGLGGLDVFYVELENDRAVSLPENLGSPINSEKDDFSLITDGARNSGFFASNRKTGYSDDDIYAFGRKCRELKLMVYDANTNELLPGAEVRLIKNGINQELHKTDGSGEINICMGTGLDYNFNAFMEGYESNSIGYENMYITEEGNAELKINLIASKLPLVKGVIRSELTNEPIAGATVVLTNTRDESTESVITGKDGRYEFQPIKKGKYVVSAVKEKYATNTEQIGKVKAKRKENTTYEQNLGMIAEGDIFRIENIYYNYGKSEIRKDARKELDNTLLPILKKYPNMAIEIRSHTDSRSGTDFNQALSDNRAKAVVAYLAKRGISEGRLLASGYGEAMLVNGCSDGVDCSEGKHQLNRRTEFKILNVNEPTVKKD